MRVSSVLSVALAAGSALAVPAAAFNDHLQQRDHHAALLRRSQESESVDQLNSQSRFCNETRGVVYKTVTMTASPVWVTEVVWVTVPADQEGHPETTEGSVSETSLSTTKGNVAASPTHGSASYVHSHHVHSQAPTQTSAKAPVMTSQRSVVDPVQTTQFPEKVRQSDSDTAAQVDSNAALPTTTSAVITSAKSSVVSPAKQSSLSFAYSFNSTVLSYSSVASSVISSIATLNAPVSSTDGQATTTTAPISSSASFAPTGLSSTFQSVSSSAVGQKVETLATSVVEPTSTTSTSVPKSTSSNDKLVPITITYSPYNDNYSCKTAAEVLSDLKALKELGIQGIRMYDVNCGSLQTVQTACVKLGLKIDQGIFIGSDGVANVAKDLQTVIDWTKTENNGDWSLYTAFTIGNEAVFGGHADPSTLISTLVAAKQQLRDAGYTGPVTTAEPSYIYIDNPDLCTNPVMDYVGINAHAYFNPYGSADQSGDFVLSQIDIVQKACNGKEVFVTETGYPSAGNVNGNQIPSPENQAIAIEAIMKAVNNRAIMFTVYDNLWMPAGDYNVEGHFGILHLFQ